MPLILESLSDSAKTTLLARLANTLTTVPGTPMKSEQKMFSTVERCVLITSCCIGSLARWSVIFPELNRILFRPSWRQFVHLASITAGPKKWIGLYGSLLG
jgi:hypothetical protein